MDEREEFLNKMNSEAESILNKIRNDANSLISKFAMQMNKSQRVNDLKKLDTERLKTIFSIANDNEHYEVCQAIKEILAERKNN